MPIPSLPKIANAAALNTGSDFHLLDHIAPLAYLLKIPLIVTEEKSFQLVQHYYPHVLAECDENLEAHLGALAKRFDTLIECKYWKPHLKTIFEKLYGKKMELIFCPHGQSDKGFGAPLLAPYAQQDALFVYGQLLIDMLQNLGIYDSIPKVIPIGDFRKKHYEKHKPFYDSLAEKEIFSRLPQNRPTLLYAPTWQDADQSTSFFTQIHNLLSQLPQQWNLIIKVHPLLEQRTPVHYYALLHLFDSISNALLLETFPPIHPILNRIDAYLGDFSSIGYDFLSFKRPMFFFPNPNIPSALLHSCGLALLPGAPIFHFIETHLANAFADRQAALYQYAFGLNALLPSERG